jgi:hypothetical protein
MFEAKWIGGNGRVVMLLVQVLVAACCFLLSAAVGNLACGYNPPVESLAKAAKP